MKKFLSRGGVLVIAIAAIIGFKFWNKSSDSNEAKSQATQVIQGWPEYSRDAAYYDQLIETAHERAFDSAYSMGGRRRSAEFDAGEYLYKLLVFMSERAKADGRPEVYALLQARAVSIRSASTSG